MRVSAILGSVEGDVFVVLLAEVPLKTGGAKVDGVPTGLEVSGGGEDELDSSWADEDMGYRLGIGVGVGVGVGVDVGAGFGNELGEEE